MIRRAVLPVGVCCFEVNLCFEIVSEWFGVLGIVR